jgi:hypothetical protein
MKGKRKTMRKMIRNACDDKSRPWIESVESLQKSGIPLNLILSESNDYGIQKAHKKAH